MCGILASARQWAKLSPDIRRRLDKRLMEFAESGHGDVKRLKGRDGMRLRVGDWRVIFYEDQEKDCCRGGRPPERSIRLRGPHECSIPENPTWGSRNSSEERIRAAGRKGCGS